MPLGNIRYKSLAPLIRDCLSTEEDEDTLKLIRDLRSVKTRGYLTKGQLEAVCAWKSSRAIRHIQANTHHRIKAATQTALGTRSERIRLESLVSLRGVSVPMASAIMMLLNPKRYGVIDIRVWQLLHRVGTVRSNPQGVRFTFDNWHQFLMILRHLAKQFHVKARDIERTLFYVHQELQDGRLYDRV